MATTVSKNLIGGVLGENIDQSGVDTYAERLAAALPGWPVLIETQTASASASLDFTTNVSGFDELILKWRIAELKTTGAFGVIQFRNVSTWRTSGYVYSGHQGDQTSGTSYNGINQAGAVTTGFPFLWDDYGGGKDTGTGEAVIRQFDDSAAKTVCFLKSIGEDQGGLMNWIDAKGAYNTNETHNGIRVTTTSGNLDGVFFLFGVNWS